MTLPPALLQALEYAVGPDVRAQGRVSGGCIHHAHKIRSQQGRYFLKWSSEPGGSGMLQSEAFGLKLLGAADDGVRVPQIITNQPAEDGCPAFVLLEWIESRGPVDQVACGRMLAKLHHSAPTDAYGLTLDNYIGRTPQVNGWLVDWIDFFRERRLIPQIDLAQRNGRMSPARRRGLERLMTRLDGLLGTVPRRPELLHGDLWVGNVLADDQGLPVLIDPAIYYGDREADLAMTTLFGGFSSSFYDAYNEVYPLSDGWRERFEIYNLYHLLNHLNLFGEGYGYQVDGVLQRLVGK